jgi:pyruvate dehydrogenase E1 component alpha subunit
MARLSKETLLEWYRQMVLIRIFETRCDELYHDKVITGVYMHLYSGHEATGVGALAALKPTDHVMTAYRDHGIALSKGVPAKPIMAEMLGKKTGTSGGKGGSMHIASKEHRMWGGYAIVGGHIPLAGVALAAQYNGTDEVMISFIGDGATNNGYFHEAVNMSGAWKLPVVWIIENNLVAMGTRIEDSTAQTNLHTRALGYGIKDGGRIDGQDILKVYDSVKEAVDYARAGNGPVLIESLTYRYKGHGVSDKSYDKRFADELEEWSLNRDPITIFEKHLKSKYKGIESELQRIHDACKAEVEEAVEFAINSPAPGYEDLISNVYVE